MQITAFLGVAHIHTPGFINTIKSRSDVKCKWVYDYDAERAARRAAELEAEVADLQTILDDPEVTSVVVCSETRHHLDLVTKAAAAGKHLFVEKPLSATAEEAEAIAEAVKKAGVVFQTGFFSRSTPHNQFIKQEIEAGHLGVITRMRYTNCHSGALGGWFDTEWRWIADKNEAGGGGYADLGAHALDIILWCLSDTCGPIVKAAATLGSATHRYGDIDEWGAGILTFKSGAIAVMEASWVDPKLHSPIEVHGTEGQILVQGGKVFYYSKHVEAADGSEWTELPAKLPHAFELFWDALEGNDVPLISIDEAAAESGAMEKLYKAAEA